MFNSTKYKLIFALIECLLNEGTPSRISSRIRWCGKMVISTIHAFSFAVVLMSLLCLMTMEWCYNQYFYSGVRFSTVSTLLN